MDAAYQKRLAREYIRKGKHIPERWNIIYDDGYDIPRGWYAQGIGANGFVIDWPVHHEYGPFRTKKAALTYAAKVDRFCKKSKRS